LLRRLQTNWGAAGLLALGVLALMWPILLGGRVLSPASLLYFSPPWTTLMPPDVSEYFNPVLSDIPTAYYPWWHYAREAIHSFSLPEWNPYALGGTPFFANPQSALLSPFSLVLWILPLDYALGALAAVQLWLLAFGTYLLARELDLSFAPSLLTGVVFGFSPFAIVWMTYPLLSVLALLPWSLWLVERIVRRGGGADALVLGLVLLAALLAGHPGSQVHLYAVVALYAAMRLVLARLPLTEALRAAGKITASLVLGAAGAAVVLLPAALMIPDTVGIEARSGGALILVDDAMRTLFFPDWWGRPSDQHLSPPVNYNEGTIYAGTIALILAAIALLSRDRWRTKLPFAVLGFIGFEAAFGLEPVRSILDVIPVLESNRNARLSLLVQLSVAILAGLGLQRLLERSAALIVAIVGAAAALVGAIGLVAADPSLHELRVTSNHFRTGTDYAIPDVVQATAVGWWLLLAGALFLVLLAAHRKGVVLATAVLALAALDAAHTARGYNPMAPAEHAFPDTTRAVEFLRQNGSTERLAGVGTTLPPDTSTVYRLRDVRGNDPPMPTLRFMRLFRLVNPTQGSDWLAIPTLTPEGLRILSALNVRWLMFPPGSTTSLPGLTLGYSGPDALVLRNPAAVPRAYLPETVKPVSSEAEALAELASPSFVARRVAIVEGARPNAARGAVRVVRDEPEKIELRATLSRGGLIVVPDTLLDGWTVTVDGDEARAIRVNSVARGVEVPAGNHTVRWSYRTPGLETGAAISAAGLAGAAAWGAWLVLARRRVRPSRVEGA
jgi:hypothetical protein